MTLKKFLILTVFFIQWLAVFSQKDPNIYDFFGGKISDKKPVFYRLVFQINNNKISGYSYTDEHGPKESKSIIQGNYNVKNHILIFRESQKLTTRKNDFYNEKCYLNGILKLEINQKVSKIEGTYMETTNANKICNKGEIRLISLDKFKYPKDTVLVAEKEKKKEKVILPTFNPDKKTTLKTDEELTIFWNSNDLEIAVWDDKKEDQDRITITLNDEKIIDNYILKNKAKKIKIPLKQKINTLKITANNTGLIGENTARIDFIDNKIIHKIISQLNVKKSVIIKIIKNN